MTERVRILKSVNEWPLKNGQNGKPSGHAKEEPNKTTRVLKDAILVAAETVGLDGKGKDGLPGYLTRIALVNPAAMCSLLAKVLTLQVHDKPERAQREVYETYEQVAARLRESGIPLKEMGRMLMSIAEDESTDGEDEAEEV